MKVAIVVGTRPEIVKMSPIIDACLERGVDFSIIDAHQHYSDNMNAAFFRELKLPAPDLTLNTIPGSHGTQIASMLTEFEEVFKTHTYDTVLVQGDTNTVLAATLMASRRNLPVGHVEAGLRSGDRTMPEEVNRVMVDHVADYCFATSKTTLTNLHAEGIRGPRVVNTGNTIVDATLRGVELSKARSQSAQTIMPQTPYMLITLHRDSNVDNPVILQGIMDGIGAALERHDLAAIFPMHPRTSKQAVASGIHISERIKTIEPLGYLDFLQLQANAEIILTDSGGVQEEACILHVPCVTLRENTERPETIAVGANTIGGTQPNSIIAAVNRMRHAPRDWTIPYGDGTSGCKIIGMLLTCNNEHNNEKRGVYVSK
jgi:UDP-N-acetylglucosamine 2-epimerase (non-hydrolysing)